VREERPVADIERLVLHQQAQDLSVGDVHDRLAGLRVAVAGLRIRQLALLVEAGEIGARDPERLALVEVAAQTEMAVGEREQRLGLRETLEVERGLAHLPRLHGKRGVLDHR
jgi:hypothetical protein